VNSIRSITRAIRRAARAKLRLSRSAWKEYKRSRGPFYRRAGSGSRHLGQIYVLGFLVLLAQRKDAHFALLVLAMYSTATVLQRAYSFQQSLYNSFDLAFFMYCPATDQQFFQHVWWSLLKSSFSIWLSAFGVFGLLVALDEMPARFWLLAAIAAILHWLLMLALLLAVDRFVPIRNRTLVSLPLYLLTFVSLFLPDWVVRSAWAPVSILPTAWLPSVFASAALPGEPFHLYLIIPSLAFIALLPVLYKSARSDYPRWELQYPISLITAEVEDEAPELPYSESPDDAETSNDLRSSRDIRPVILTSLDWNASPWLQRIVGKSLNAAEKTTAEFLLGGQLGSWNESWLVGIKIAGIGLALLLLPIIPLWIGILVGLVGTGFAVPLLGGSWLGLQLVPMFGTVRLACAGLPVSYLLASRVIAKINCIRLLSWLPVFVIYALAIAWRAEAPFQFALSVALRVVFTVFSFQPILILGKHSHGTNDSRQINFHSALFLLLALFLGTIYVGCGIAFLVMPFPPKTSNPVLLTIFAVAMISSSFLLWLGYRLFYDRGRLDAIRVGDR